MQYVVFLLLSPAMSSILSCNSFNWYCYNRMLCFYLFHARTYLLLSSYVSRKGISTSNETLLDWSFYFM